MTRRRTVLSLSVLALLGFAAAAVTYVQRSAPVETTAAPDVSVLERSYSPRFGPDDAPVTIVEFFDPACEACRAFHPIVRQILADYPEDVRLVLRYTFFHDGSEEVVRILEAARLQDVFEPVLEAVLAAQPEWAAHGAPQIDRAWAAAGEGGLDIASARQDTLNPEMTAVVNQDMADVTAANITQTPTFFVNGRPLPSFGAQELVDLVKDEVEAARSASAVGG